MTHYSVEVHLGTLMAEVEADNEDDAITAAIEEWDADATAIFAAGTFSAREVSTDGD